MEDTRHVNMTDPTTESVYCHLQHQVAKFDGEHVDKYCWGCPFWGGLAGGFGVVCVYDDPGAQGAEVKYTKPTAAMAEAPEAVDDPDSIASQAGIAARDARIELSPPEQEQADISAQEAPAGEGAPAEQAQGGEQSQGQQATPAKAPSAGGTPAVAAPKRGFPPKKAPVPAAPPAVGAAPARGFPPKKKPLMPPGMVKSATPVDVISEMTKLNLK